jgi:hypothetical protein
MLLHNWARKVVGSNHRPSPLSPLNSAREIRPTIEELEGRTVPTSSISIANASVVEGDSGSALMNFTVTRSGDLDSRLRVTYRTADGTAVAGADYTPTNGAVTMPVGATTATISVPISGNMLREGNRDFSLELTDVAPAVNFSKQGAVPTGTVPFAVALGDLNGDGKSDLVIANSGSNTLSVILNTTATGSTTPTFSPPTTLGTQHLPRGVTIGDVDGDGRHDLVVSNFGSHTVSVFINNTDVGANEVFFDPQQTFATSFSPRSSAIADLNRDGKADLAVSNQTGGTVSVLLATGDVGSSALSFTEQQTFAARTSPNSIAAADINGDGKLDLAVVNGTANSVSVLLNTMADDAAEPSFADQQTFSAGQLPFSMAVGDLNGDGKVDFAVANGASNNVSILLNQTIPGSSTLDFHEQKNFSTGASPRSVVIGDVNGDGKPDLGVTAQVAGDVEVLLNTTAAGSMNARFCSQQTFASGAQPFAAAIGDLNGDGKLDLAVTNRDWSCVSVILNDTLVTHTTPTATITNGTAIGTIVEDDAPTATTTTLSATPNASTGGELVTFTATVSPSPEAAGTVTFLDNGVAIAGGSNVALVGGSASFQVSALATGTHSIAAAYSGAVLYLASVSEALDYNVAPSPNPTVLSATTNGNIAALAGTQHSRVASVVVTFDQAVELDAGAVTLALHTNNVSFDGAALPDGYGTLPASLNLASADNINWIVTFVGNTEGGADGLHSLKDGIYDLNIDGAKVHSVGTPASAMSANFTTTFHRLYGDTGAAATPPGGAVGADFGAIVNAGDNLTFRGGFNNPSTYQAYLDFNGDGVVGTGDNLQFRGRFNKALTWRV